MEFVVPTRFRCASSAAMFVLTLRDMLFLLEERLCHPTARVLRTGTGFHAFLGGLPSQYCHRPRGGPIYSLERGFVPDGRALREDVDVEALVLAVLVLVAL